MFCKVRIYVLYGMRFVTKLLDLSGKGIKDFTEHTDLVG